MFSRASERGPPSWMWSRHACVCDLMPHPCLHCPPLSLAFSSHLIWVPYHQTWDSEINRCLGNYSGYRWKSLHWRAWNTPVCWLVAQKGTPALTRSPLCFHTGGPTADPTTVNIFTPLTWHVCCVVTLCCASAAEPLAFKRTPGSTLLWLVRGETLIKNLAR